MPGAPQPNDLWKDFPIMRALEPEVMDAIWQAVEPLLVSDTWWSRIASTSTYDAL
jgi:hypothetical protein